MTNGSSNGSLTSGHRHCGIDETSRLAEVVGHLRLALSRHVRQLHQAGLPVPREVEELAGLLMHLASLRQGPPRGADQLTAALPPDRPVRLLVTKKEAAQRLGVSVRTLERLVATGRLPQVHVERLARFRVSDLEAYVSGLAASQSPPYDAEARAFDRSSWESVRRYGTPGRQA
jgi:excisionase family DNA binding protein